MRYLIECVRQDGSSLIMRLYKDKVQAEKDAKTWVERKAWVRQVYLITFNEDGELVGTKEVVK